MDGILIIDKPSGLTSHDVVQRIRRWLGQGRVGHAGTLDPDATGVLVLCLGRATRLAEYLSGENKEYAGVMALGAATDTQDASGTVIGRVPSPSVCRDDLEKAARSLTGSILQRPPSFSAVRIRGKRAYELARAGRAVDLPARPVSVYRFDVGQPTPRGELVDVPFHVQCSKGTYVRTLCHDLGVRIGVPAHMVSLRRVRQGPFHVEEALSWREVEEEGSLGRLADRVKPMFWALRDWPQIPLSAEEAEALRNGRDLPIEAGRIGEGRSPESLLAAVYRDEVAAVCRREGERIRPLKVFLT
ncbi:MAG: tRNA pseudouridine(55) synthase TruB [Kyrpidia sp.]|nr:tRNA pseudouridine(55) synthase TruB [Kyrpidia sp.]